MANLSNEGKRLLHSCVYYFGKHFIDYDVAFENFLATISLNNQQEMSTCRRKKVIKSHIHSRA